jgi:GrpB-like predicted nucleotidyltransferase (UPF0157 family)
VLIGATEKRDIVIVDYDAAWPDMFRQHASIIREAMGRLAIGIEHVGSTSVPGLAAKPIIDILLIVEDSSDESLYVPALTAAGYELRVREPEWHEHRMLRTKALDVHVHVFSDGSVEATRMLAFRDLLRESEGERIRYESLKRELAKADWPDMNAYAEAKTETIEQMLSNVLVER